jgi:ABC-2 type transport system ATP-binding protein
MSTASLHLPIAVRKASKAFGNNPVLNALDWTPTPGRVTGLLGKNGAGKTTLMECLLGLRTWDSGESQILGSPSHTLPDSVRAEIGFVPQASDLFEWLTTQQMLSYMRSFYPRWNETKVNDLLKRWQIDANKRISELSAGQKQRVSIIRALGPDPSVLVLDEPASSLDPSGRRDFLREVIDIAIERQATVVFSTHILTDLERVAVEVAFLNQGKITLSGALDDLSDEVRAVHGDAKLLDHWHPKREISRDKDNQGRTRIVAWFDEQELKAVEQLQTQGAQVQRLQLEDLFVEATQ